jgi:galactokinase
MPFEGFGGSILAFLDSNKVPLVVKTLMNDYYNNKGIYIYFLF